MSSGGALGVQSVKVERPWVGSTHFFVRRLLILSSLSFSFLSAELSRRFGTPTPSVVVAAAIAVLVVVVARVECGWC